MLHRTDYPGPETSTPLLIAHGLFGSGRNWATLAKAWAERRPVTAVDMRNHGDSDWKDTHNYNDMAEDLAEVIDGRADVLGHSMGGKAAMVLALSRPEKIRRLVVVDIAPVSYRHSQMGLVEAMRALPEDAMGSRREADAALSESVPEAGVRAFLLQSLDTRERRWKINLSTLATEMPKILAFPEIDAVFEGPALFLAGANSDYVSEDHEESIRRLFPQTVVKRVAGAGHWVHAEQPQIVKREVETFLDA